MANHECAILHETIKFLNVITPPALPFASLSNFDVTFAATYLTLIYMLLCVLKHF